MHRPSPRPLSLSFLSAIVLSLCLSACGRSPAATAQAESFSPAPDVLGAYPAGGDAASPVNPPGDTGGGAAAPAAADGLQRVTIMDQNGFGAPIPAMTIDLPAGWQPVQGGVIWDAQARCGNSPRFDWRTQSPDGQQAFEMLPTEVWQYNNLPVMQGMQGIETPCPTWQISTVRDYLQSLVQRKRPGARVLDFRARPDLIRFPPPANTAQDRYWKESGQVLIAYTANGVDVRESIGVVVQFHQMTMMGTGPNDVRIFVDAMTMPAIAFRAPAGQLSMGLLERIGNSTQIDPQWQARMDKHNGVLARQGLKGQIERGDISRRTGQEIADINQRGWQSGQATDDGIQRATIDGINNIDRYQDPVSGNEVQLDNRYDHAWRAGDGTYIQSNDPNLNQQGALGADAEEMERSR